MASKVYKNADGTVVVDNEQELGLDKLNVEVVDNWEEAAELLWPCGGVFGALVVGLGVVVVAW